MRTLLRRLCSLHDREDPGSADSSGERVFRRVRERFRLIIGEIAHAEELEDLEQKLAVVAEGDRTVVPVSDTHLRRTHRYPFLGAPSFRL